MKRLVKVTVFVMMLLMLLPVVAMAAPYSTYTYSIDGELLSSPDAYVPDTMVSLVSLGVESNGAYLVDIETDAEGNVYITDQKLNRIIVADKYYQYKYTIEKFVNSNGVDDTFNTPSSTFVVNEGDMKGLYVCDTSNKRIVVFNLEDGSFNREITEPVTDLMAENSYAPTSCVVDKHGRIFVVSRRTTEGIIVMTSKGEFINFIGAPKVSISAFDALVQKITPSAAELLSYVPTTYKNIDLDAQTEEFVYATIVFEEDDHQAQIEALTTKLSDYSPVRLLNATGVDIMHRNGFFAPAGEVNVELNAKTTGANKNAPKGVSSIVDISSGPNGVWSIIDSKRSKVYTYDKDGNLLHIFGDMGTQLGNITTATAISYQGSNIIVLDSTLNTFTTYRRTEYAEILDEAIYYQSQGDYDEAVKKWEEVLARNNNFDSAYVAIGKSLYRDGKYEEAIRYYQNAYDTENYAIAFKDMRKEKMETLLIPMIILIVVVFILIGKVFGYAAKVNKDAQLVVGRKSFKQEFLYGFHLIFHPFDGYWDLKHEKRGSVRASLLIIGLTIVAFYYQSIGTGYYYNPQGTYMSVFMQIASVAIPLLLWVIANWCFTTLFDGEGSFKDIFIASSYALYPLPVFVIVSTILTNVLVGDEGQITSMLVTLAFIWLGFLLVLGMQVTHDYSMGKNIVTVIMTIVGMIFIMFIALLFISLISKMISFVSTIISELSYR
ncbi:MAG: YIP1 family protein [Clostridia bacterium]|nr:YIP1 family protein [Clostridia bacterium]MBO5374766.1 YIP1 family protein [Clostridia bacterium]